MSTPDISLGAPRGMRDFYPEDMAARKAIFNAWEKASELHCFQPYDACVVESMEILKRKSGEEISDQIYTFTDKSGRELALRPEMTPSLARMIASRQGALSFPLKWYAIAQCFRYERTTRGRKREHFQWNLDIIGEESLAAEAEIIAVAVKALNLLGLNKKDFTVKFSSRALLADLLASLQINPSLCQSVFMILDKRGKISDSEIQTMLIGAGLDSSSVQRVFDLLAVKSLGDAEALLKTASTAHSNILRFLDCINAYNLGDTVVFDIGVIRGLSYYTGIVFECHDTENKLRAIFGGGRYDNLLGDMGGKPMTAVGLGFGDVVLAELLADKALTPGREQLDGIAVGYLDENQRLIAMRIADALRLCNSKVDLAGHPEKAKAFFARCGGNPMFQHAIYIGPDDITKGVLRKKNLQDRTEQQIAINELLQGR
jgi:histidyl-tRNA synthetase